MRSKLILEVTSAGGKRANIGAWEDAMKILVSALIAVAVVVAGCGGSVAQATPVPTEVVATPTPAPTPAPTPVGAGVITFGKKYDPTTLKIANPLTEFSRTTQSIAWSALLSEEPAALSLTFMLIRKKASGVENLVYKWVSDVSNPTYTRWANKTDLMYWADDKAGTYVLRILRDDGTVLAEGSFRAK